MDSLTRWIGYTKLYSIVIAVNYRTNVFGFLCHPELREEAPQAPCNLGNLDQQAAARWAKRNIAAFGGAPDRTTIAGQAKSTACR